MLKMNLKWQLLTGFLAVALMTVFAGGCGIVAIELIKNNMSETAYAVNTSVQKESSQAENIIELKSLIDCIVDAQNQEDIDVIEQGFLSLQKSEVISSVETSGLNQDVSEMLSLKESEIKASNQLAQLDNAMVSRFLQTHKKIAKVVDDNVFTATISIEDATKHVSDIATTDVNARLSKIHTDTTQAIAEITAGLAIRAYAYQIHANLETILLSQDIAYVDYSLATLEAVFANIAVELKNLTANVAAKDDIETMVREIKTMFPALLEAKKTVLVARADLEKVSEDISDKMKNVNKVMLLNSDELKKAVNNKLTQSSKHAKQWSATLLVICIFSFVISAIVGVSISRAIAMSIHTIVVRVKAIAEGDLSKNIAIKRNDEIGVLANHFNTMVDTLRGLLAKSKMASNQIMTTSTEILATSRQQALGAKNQSSAVSQTTSASVELSKAAEQIGESVKVVSQMANHVLEGMANIKKATDQTGEILESLNKKSKQIGKITELIDDVADQTNLLAVNASIEAARAGEQGRGFTVVADQIGKLADSTAKSTKDINSLIELIQHEMSNAIISMEQSSSNVEEEIKLAEDSAEKSKEIAMNANQQMSGSRQIAEAMNSIDETMKEIAVGSEQSASVVQQLITLADELNDSIAKFKVEEDDSAKANSLCKSGSRSF
jgi:methyl-accepting chemotaxis protein